MEIYSAFKNWIDGLGDQVVFKEQVAYEALLAQQAHDLAEVEKLSHCIDQGDGAQDGLTNGDMPICGWNH